MIVIISVLQLILTISVFFFSNYSHYYFSCFVRRYFRCIGLSRGPNCDADIITRLVSKVGNIIGDWLAGKGTRSRQSKENTKEKGKSEVLSATVINGNSVKHSKTSKNGGSKEITEKRREHDDNHIGSNSNSISNEDIGNDSRSDKLLSSNDKNKNKINKKSTQEVDVEKARKPNVQVEDGIDVVINSGIKSKKKLEKKTVKKTEKRVLNRILNKTESHLNKQKDALFNLHGIEGNSSSHEQSGKSKKGDGIESHPGSTVRDKTESRGKGNNRNKEIKPDEKNNEEERESTNHGAGRIIFICSGK